MLSAFASLFFILLRLSTLDFTLLLLSPSSSNETLNMHEYHALLNLLRWSTTSAVISMLIVLYNTEFLRPGLHPFVHSSSRTFGPSLPEQAFPSGATTRTLPSSAQHCTCLHRARTKHQVFGVAVIGRSLPCCRQWHRSPWSIVVVTETSRKRLLEFSSCRPA